MTPPDKTLLPLQKKAKERSVKTITIEYDLETLVKKIKKNVIKLNPEYQRNHRWKDETSSRLIESLILNIPIPTIYISQDVDVDAEVEDDVARYSVIDGQQRLTAIYNYINNKFRLEGLNSLDELNGLKYEDLPPFLTRRLEERTITCLRIDSTIDPQVKFDIFERLNSGSVELTAQELRNSNYRGKFNQLLKKLSTNETFTELARLDPESNKVKQMYDRELVLRFFALAHNDGFRDYVGGFKNFLNTKMNSFSQLDHLELATFETNFINTFEMIKKSFGNTPFAKYRCEEKNTLNLMSKFNVAVFDSVVVPFYKMSQSKTQPITNYDKFKTLFTDIEYFKSIEGSTNDMNKVHTRIKKSLEIFEL